MGILKVIKKWFSLPKKDFLDSRHRGFYPLDVDDIATELRLEEEARRFGEKGIPAPDATTLDGVEEKIIHRIEKVRQDYLGYASLRLTVLTEALAGLDVTEFVNRAQQTDHEFERKANTLLSGSAPFIENLAETARCRQQEFEDFKKTHHIQREPRLLSAGEIYFQYALLSLVVVIEGALNAYFFSLGLEGGLIEGFFWAAAFALLNVTTAFCWGKFALPYVFHVHPLKKIGGYLGIPMALAWITSVSLLIAHYRDALIADVLDPAKVVLEAIKSHPFSLTDINSWILFGLSGVFALSALYRGLRSDDPYPKYGDAARRALEAHEEYLEKVEDIRSELEELKQTELKQLEESVTHAQSLLSQRSNLIQSKKDTELNTSRALESAQQSMIALLTLYRNTNELYRKGLPKPAYFNRTTAIKNVTLPDFSTNKDDLIKADQQKLIENLLSKVEILRANIQASFNTKYDGLKPLSTHFERDVQKI